MWAAIAAALVLGSGRGPVERPSRVVFASARTGIAQLYSVKPSGQGLAQLTFGSGNWGYPVPSPDGRFVAAFRGPELWVKGYGDLYTEFVAAPRPELWVMRADGSDARLIASNAADVSWSGDSRRLVYVSGGIRTMAVPGGRPRQITQGYSDSSPSLSPDGGSIAFVRGSITAAMLVVRRNGRERVISRGLGGQLYWSPNGKWIAIRGSDTVSVVERTGGLVQALSAVPKLCATLCLIPRVAWSPDSRLLAYEDREGIKLVERSVGTTRLVVKGTTQGLAWSPHEDAIAFATTGGVGTATLDGQVRMLVRFGPGEALPGLGWSSAQTRLRYHTPEETPLLVRVSARELEARVPITQFAADGDRVAYWLCPHVLGAWRPGDEQQVALGPATLAVCRLPSWPIGPGTSVSDLVLAGDRLAYLTSLGYEWELRLTTLDRRDEGVAVATASEYAAAGLAQLEELVGGGPTLVYGARGLRADYGTAESIWRLDGATPVQIARRSDDLQPLAVDEGRIVARRADGALDLLGLDGSVLESFPVPALGAALAGDDLVVLVQGEFRDYSVSTGHVLHEWPLPDVPSSGRCRIYPCQPARLTLDDAARGLALYTLDGTVHLLRLRDGADRTLAEATAAELTGAGLFYTYRGEKPWPGRIRFVPFAALPL